MNVGFMTNISRYWSQITSSSRKAHYTGSYFFKYTLWCTVFVSDTETLIDTHFSLFPWEMVFYVLFHSFLSLCNVVFIRNSLHKFNTEIVKAVSCLFVFILFFYLFFIYFFFTSDQSQNRARINQRWKNQIISIFFRVRSVITPSLTIDLVGFGSRSGCTMNQWRCSFYWFCNWF